MPAHTITTLAELSDYSAALLGHLAHHVSGTGATVLSLSGDLGAGKTALVQCLARQLGVTETVTSPTFVVMKLYDTTNDTFTTLVHIDAYRIEDLDEMRPLGFTALLAEPQTLICIEWGERVATLLPPATVYVSIAQPDDVIRIITVSHGH